MRGDAANERAVIETSFSVFLAASILARVTDSPPLLTTWIDRDFADDAIGPLRFLAGQPR
ncbi:MAG: hypothetical protein ACR2LK_04845 [Solirubrobacteraceae bacterium]